MPNNMFPSPPITPGQVDKMMDPLKAMLRKSGLPREEIQKLFAGQVRILAEGYLAAVRKSLEENCGVIDVFVPENDEPRSSFSRLAEMGWDVHSNPATAVRSMSHGGFQSAHMRFFKMGYRDLSDAQLVEEYRRRGLRAVHPKILARYNKLNPTFVDTHPNMTHWKDEKGEWVIAYCYVSVLPGRPDKRVLRFAYSEHVHDMNVWFAGVNAES